MNIEIKRAYWEFLFMKALVHKFEITNRDISLLFVDRAIFGSNLPVYPWLIPLKIRISDG